MIIDHNQRELALDWQQSFIVQAPAGSGKTELLIQRFLVLLAKVERVPEQVIAITFTKKAAQEMRARVIQALTRAENEPKPEAAHLQKTWELAQAVLLRDKKEDWQLLKQPNRLSMLTIDSFCATLARQMPLVSRFGAMPEITEDANVYYKETVEKIWFVLAEDEKWQKTVRNLLWHFDNQLLRLQNLMAELLSKREQWLNYDGIIHNTEQITQTLEEHLHHLIEDVLIEAEKNFPVSLTADSIELLTFSAHQCVQGAIDNQTLISCANLTALPAANVQDFIKWKGIAHYFLTSDGSIRKRLDKNLGFPADSSVKTKAEKEELKLRKSSMQVLLNNLAEHPDFINNLRNIQQLPPADYKTTQQSILVDLIEILIWAAAELMVAFQQNGVCDFNQVLQGALYALGTPEQPSDLALALDYRIQHILVDEFQDTSIAQFRLLECLTAGWTNNDGRTLFLVGDPMQSIYRFRQAEVGLFLRAWEQGIGTINLVPLVLEVNFRSTTTVVEWINRHMTVAFPDYKNIGVGAVPFVPATAYKQQEASAVQVHFTADITQEAQQVLSLVQHALNDPQQEHIAILVSARSHLSAILPALQAAGIDYQAVELEPLSSRAALQDLIALTRALLHPADNIAWLAILRAPWCGLTLKELTRIVEINPDACIMDNLLSITDWDCYSEHTRYFLPKLIQVMQTAVTERQCLSTSQWVLNTWLALNGPACYNQETLAVDVQQFFSFLEKSGTEIFYFLPEEWETRLEKLYAAGKTTHSRVQIMTMHKAKGLEFDTVIIPSLHKTKNKTDKDLLTWWERPREDGQAELLIAALNAVGDNADPLYQYIWQQKKQALTLETTRLLYVAMTRAKKYLHLTAVVRYDAEEKGYKTPESNSLLHCIWNTVSAEAEWVGDEINQAVSVTEQPKLLQRLHLQKGST